MTSQLKFEELSLSIMHSPYPIPAGWVWVRLDMLAELKGGITKGQKRRPGEPLRLVPYLRVANVQRGYLDLSDVTEIDATEREIAELQLRLGDVLFNEGGDRDKLGRGWVWEGQLPLCIHQNHVFRARIWGDMMLPKFLSMYSNTYGQQYFLQEGKQTTNLASINLTKLSALPVPVPPRKEQRRIVDKLEALSARSRRAKEALDAIPPLLERFRQSVLASAFRGDLTAAWREKNPDVEPADKLLARIRTERRRRWEEAELAKMRAKGKVPGDDRWKEKYEEPEPVDASELPELPEGWAWASLDLLAVDAKIGLVRSALEQGADKSFPYIRMQHYDLAGRWHWRDVTCVDATPEEAAEYELKEGDVLFNTRNSYELVGKVAVWPKNRPGYLYNNNLMRLRFVGDAMPMWLGQQMMSPGFAARISSSKSATTSVCAIYGRDLFKQPLIVAPIPEQVEIIRRLETALDYVQRVEVTFQSFGPAVQQLDRAILAKAFRGELVPQDPNDEPASVLLERIRAEADKNGTPARPGRRRAATVPLFPDLEGPAAQEPAKKKRPRSPARAR